jgi:O-antigen/teichoic acid export membrane protein
MTAPVGGDPAVEPGPLAADPSVPREDNSVRTSGVLQRAQITLFGSAIGGVLAIVNEIICARYLGVNTYGLYAFALVLARIAEVISAVGLPVATLHFVSVYRDQKLPRKVLGVILSSLLPPFLIGGAFMLVLWSVAPVLANAIFDNANVVPYIRAMAVAVPFMGLSEVLGVITRGFGHAVYYVVIRSLVPPVVFFCALSVLTISKGDPHLIPAGFALGMMAAVVVGVAAVLKVGGLGLFRLRPELPLRTLYGYSFPVLLNTLMYLVVVCTPILLLGVMQGDKEVGIYRACLQIVIPFDMVLIAFNAAVGHLYPVLERNNRREELALLVRRITLWMSSLALAMLLGVALNRHDLMGLMGPDFVAGANTLAVLALGHALLCCIGSAGYLLVMSGRQRYETTNAIYGAALAIVLNYLLIPPFGTLGAAGATALSCLLVCVMRVYQVKRLMDINVVRMSLGRIAALSMATALAVLLASDYLPIGEGGGIASFILRNALMVMLFASLYWHFGLDLSDRQMVSKALREHRSRAKASR